MPTYGYECLSCDNQFEIFQSIKDDALTTCAECGGALRKRIYPVGISFKGSGFYVNDYAAKPAGGSGETPKSDAPKSDAPAEAKSEPKSDAGTEAKSEPKPEAAKPAAAKTEAAASK